ncbi:MAG TPA: hypothetical protein VM537_29685 [Anaerolineae bacterium]|nr:hypothetical protein [Anaerolineae bacterium]
MGMKKVGGKFDPFAGLGHTPGKGAPKKAGSFGKAPRGKAGSSK